MTVYTLYNQAARSPSFAGSGSNTTYGVAFTLSSSASLTGIWIYSGASDAQLPTACGVYDTLSQTLVAQNTSPTWSGALGSGWVKCTFNGSVTLDSRANGYVAVVAYGGGNKGFISSAFPVTSGILTAPVTVPNSGGTVNNCPFVTGTGGSLTWPTSGSNDDWLVDVEVTSVVNVTASGSVMPPLIPPHPQFTRLVLEEAWSRADWQAQGVADLSVAFASTSGGVDTYNVTSPWNNYANAGTQQMRVLKPTAPNTSYPHSFLIMLPVDTNQDTTFGDSIGTAQTLGAHNTYNLTCVQPGYAPAGVSGTGPWFADNPLDPTISQEKFTLLVTAWIKKNLATTGTEQVYLIGFSRSGLGGQFLQFRHPYVYAATASWDAPFEMSVYNGSGGNPDQVFGTDVSFQANYRLPTHLAGWQSTGQFGPNRIWIGQGPAFTDITTYDTDLTTAGIPHTFTFSNTVESHAWHTDWVAAALQAIIPSNEPTVLPQSIVSHPVFTRLLEVARYRMDGGPAAATVTQQGTATIVGAGALTANVIQGAGASLTASGLLAASATQGAGATLTGAGTLASNIQQGSGGSFGGAGTLSVNVIQQVVAALAGTGTLTANVIQGAGATLTGLGVVASNVIQGSGGSMGAAGTLSVNATQDVIAALTGAGTLSAVVIQGATATLTGAGVVSAGSQAGGGSMSGSGAMSVNAIQGAGSPLTAAGLLAASVVQGAGLSAVASGLVTVSATELAGVTLTGLGVVTAAQPGGARSALLLVFLP